MNKQNKIALSVVHMALELLDDDDFAGAAAVMRAASTMFDEKEHAGLVPFARDRDFGLGPMFQDLATKLRVFQTALEDKDANERDANAVSHPFLTGR